ncbi:MAG: hypothetical protein KC503_42715 [Myxococcales bacterium]|nr:hypothetical protein [Myxococcales bacterium]
MTRGVSPALAAGALLLLLLLLPLSASARPSDARCVRGSVRDANVRRIIARVFGRHGRDAIRVARCESGRAGTHARNGQFRGLFQMGRYARRKYGHSRCARAQTRAAYRYFVDVGQRWRPWHNCRPQRRRTRRRRRRRRRR